MTFPDPNQSTSHTIGNKTWNWDGKKWVAEPLGSDVPTLSGNRDQGMVGVSTPDTFTLTYNPDALTELVAPGLPPALPLIGTVAVVTDNDTPEVGQIVSYGYSISGNANDTSFTVTTDVPGAVPSGNRIQYQQAGTGKVYVEVTSPTASDTPQTGELDVTVTTPLPTIGPITITSDSGNFTPDQGDVVTYSYDITGNSTNHSGTLSVTGANHSINGNTVTWLDAGQAQVEFRVVDPGASDSPRTGTQNITIAAQPYIGDITILGNTDPVEGTSELYTASYNGTVGTVSAQWSIDPALGATQNQTIPNSFDFSGANVGVTGDITVEYTSLAAWDSPKSESISVTVAAGAPPPYQNISNISGPSVVSVGGQENFEVTYLGTDTPSYNWTYAAPYEFTQNASITGTTADVSFLNRYHATDGDLTTYATIHFMDWYGALLRWDVEDKAFPDRVDTLEILVSDPTGNGSSGQIANHRTNTATKFDTVFAADPNNPQWSMLLNAGTNQPMYENWGNGGTRDNLVKFLWSVPSGATVTNSLNIHAIRVGSDIIRLDPRNQLAADIGDLIQVKFNGPGDHKISCTCTDAGGSTTEDFDVQITGDLDYTQPPDPVPSFEVTVVNTPDGNKYFIDGVRQDTVAMTQGVTYRFNTYDTSNYGHPLRIYTDSNKTTEVTQGVTIGSSHTFFTPASTGTFSYQCSAHANMGGDIVVT